MPRAAEGVGGPDQRLGGLPDGNQRSQEQSTGRESAGPQRRAGGPQEGQRELLVLSLPLRMLGWKDLEPGGLLWAGLAGPWGAGGPPHTSRTVLVGSRACTPGPRVPWWVRLVKEPWFLA